MREKLRFILDTESGFVFDTENDEWLTTAEEVFLAMEPENGKEPCLKKD